VRSAIALRKGVCLAAINRFDEAQTAIRSGLPTLQSQGAAFAADVSSAHLALARIAMVRLDYATAIEEAKGALAVSTGVGKFQPLFYLARLTAFDGGPEPLAYADEALALLKASSGASKDQIATVQTFHARVLLNQGKYQEAYAELKNSLKLQGGLTMKVSLADIVTRADLALAALLVNKRDEARNYLAYTGAGRLNNPLATAANMNTPLCGGMTGLKRNDFAVVEFSFDEDGSVTSASPIYTTGGREVALEFARAVSQWSWAPKDAKAIPAFFRSATRVEMRCSTAGETPSIVVPLEEAFGQWAGPAYPAPDAADSSARAVPLLLAAMQKAEASKDEKALVVTLVRLGNNPVVTAKDRDAYLARAGMIAAPIAPTQVTTFIALSRSLAGAGSGRRYRDGLRAILAQPAVADDALSAATVRLLLALPGYLSSAPADADSLLAQVADDSRLPPAHPLKVNALLQLASRAAVRGELETARRYFAQTGLTEQQCALIGVSPAMRSTGASSSDFPMEAMRMGFEGWVRTEFDIAANGKTVDPRAVISYPPFVFNDAATGVARDARFQASYRPDGGNACTGEQRSVVFRLP
jgi:tetratricopeptide (TPR) repeat protein